MTFAAIVEALKALQLGIGEVQQLRAVADQKEKEIEAQAAQGDQLLPHAPEPGPKKEK